MVRTELRDSLGTEPWRNWLAGHFLQWSRRLVWVGGGVRGTGEREGAGGGRGVELGVAGSQPGTGGTIKVVLILEIKINSNVMFAFVS